jgi:hypothetical protein
MNVRSINAALLATASLGLALGVRLAAWPLVRVVVPTPARAAAVVSTAVSPLASDSLAHSIVARDPFRVTRRPSNVVYDPVRLAQPATPPAPKPALVLVGIVWDSGRDATALVEGLPGVDGPRPVRSGETIAGLRVKAIKPDRVVITGLDTTWTLTVREPWR